MELAQRCAAAVLACALAAACGSSPSPAPVTPVPGEVWTTYRGDLARDGHPPTATLDANAAGRLALVWRVNLHGAVDGTPAVGGGLVIAGSATGELKAFNSADGGTVWSRRGLGAITGSPTIAADRVLVGSLTGHVHAVDLRRGSDVWDWQGPAGAAVWASPVVYGDEVIVGVASPYGDQPLVPGRLYGLQAATGVQIWTMCVMAGCAPGGGIWSTPAVDSNGNAFVGVGNPVDGVLAFHALTGERVWMHSLYADDNRDLDVGASPIVLQLGGHEVVAQASVSGLFAVLRASDGGELWQRMVVQGTAVHGLLASPAYDGIRLYAASASPSTGIHALQPSDGTETWVHETALPVYSAPALGDGVVVFGTGAVLGDTNSGSILFLSSTDGRVLFTFDTHAAVRSGPAIAGRLIVVGDAAGGLLAFRPRS